MKAICCALTKQKFIVIIADLFVKDDTLYATHLRTEYRINVEDIENLTMITTLPKWSKSDGMDYYMSGYDDAQTKAIYEALWNND